MRKTILLFFCICCFLTTTEAQTCQPTWTNYTTVNSGILASNAVQGVTVDAAGNIWFATGGSGGVSKFDGTTWTTYTTGMPNTNCYGIGVDNSGNIWVGVSNNILKFNGSTWTVYNSSNSGFPGTGEVRSIKKDAAGNLWVSTQAGLAMFNGSTWTVYNPTNSGISSYGIMDVAFDAAGKKWIATQGGGVSVFDGTVWTTYNTGNSGLPNNEVWAVGIHPVTGDKWFGTLGSGVCKFDGSTWTTYNTSNSGLLHNNVRAIEFDNDGRIYFGGAYSNTGVSVFDGTAWTTYTPSNSNLVSSYIMDMTRDAQGRVWAVGSGGFGASVITPCPPAPTCTNDTTTVTVHICPGDLPYTWNGHTITATGAGVDTLFLQNTGGCDSLTVLNLLPQNSIWTTYTTAQGLVNNNVRSVAIDAAGNKWFGTSGGGVSRFDGSVWTSFTNANSGINNYISDAAIAPENNGNVWIGTQGGGAYVYNGSTWTAYNVGNSGIGANAITGIDIDQTGNKWFAAYNGGVSRFNGTTWTLYGTAAGLPAVSTECVAVDNLNRVWAGFGSTGGASMFNGTTWTTYNTGNSGLVNNGVSAIAASPAGAIWFATANGVSRLNGSIWTTYNTGNSGILSNNVTDVAIAANGDVWITTANGASVFNGTSWTSYNTVNSGILANITVDVAVGSGEIWFAHSGFGGASSFTDPCQPTCNPTTGTATHTACDSFTWINGVTYTANNTTATHTLVNAGGCDSTVTLNLTIVPSPALSVTGNLTVCDAVDLSDVTINDAHNTGATFAWFSDAACTTPVANPGNVTASGTYYVTGTAAACSDTVSLNVTVNASPVLSVNGPVNSCNTIDLAIIAINNTGGSGAVYAWFTDAACTTPVADPGHITASGTYYVTGTSAACTDTLGVTINMGMAPDLSIAATFHGCDVMNSDTLTITDANATGAAYTWFSDAACTIPVTNHILASGTYYAVGISGGCSDTVSTVVTINVTFTPSVTVSTDNLTVCAGTNVTFTATLTDGGSNPSYQWYKNGSPVGTDAGVYSTVSLTSTDEIYVVVSIPEPCAASGILQSNSVTVTVTPVSVPQVSITVAPGNIFTPGQQVTFTALASAAGSNPTFTWLKNGSPIPGAPTTTTYSTTGLQNGDVISCIVHSNAVCATPASTVSNSITMTHVSGSGIVSNELWTTVTVFPNPAYDMVNVSMDTQKSFSDVMLRLVDVSGRTVWEQRRNIEAGKHQFSIETAALAQGIYHLQLAADGQIVAMQKVIVAK